MTNLINGKTISSEILEELAQKIAKAKQAELGITDATKKGLLMSAIMKDLKGKADGSAVKEAVDSLF